MTSFTKGGGGSAKRWHYLIKAYLVKLVTRGREGLKSSKMGDIIYGKHPPYKKSSNLIGNYSYSRYT